MGSVTRRTSSSRGRRDAVQGDVLEAVERLLAHGASFTSLGVGRIADEVGMARSTFYGHFADKATLLQELTAEATRELFASAGAWVQDDASTAAQHVEVIRTLVRGYRRHEPLLRAVTEVAGYDADVAAFWTDRLDAFALLLRERLERDRDTGRMTVPVDPAVTATFIAWGTDRVIAAHVRTQPPQADDAFAESFSVATFAAMGRGAAR